MSERNTNGFVASLAVLGSIVALVIAGLGLYVAAGDDGGGSVVAAGPAVEVTLADFSIDPEPVVVGVGGSVDVTNHGNTAHNLRRLALLETNIADLSFAFSHDLGNHICPHLGTKALAVFETPDQIQGKTAAIYQQAVASTAMPLGNLTGMTPKERELLGAWISQGAPLP